MGYGGTKVSGTKILLIVRFVEEIQANARFRALGTFPSRGNRVRELGTANIWLPTTAI